MELRECVVVCMLLSEKAEGGKVPRFVGLEAGEPCAEEMGNRLVRGVVFVLVDEGSVKSKSFQP